MITKHYDYKKPYKVYSALYKCSPTSLDSLYFLRWILVGLKNHY